jgi:hypothetical protein
MRLKDFTTLDQINTYLTKKGNNHKTYKHYTNLKGLLGMLSSKHIWLSRMDKMNDKQELEKIICSNPDVWKSTYVFSLNYNSSENLALWGLYGIPWETAVCITFPRELLIKLTKDTKVYKDTNVYSNQGNVNLHLTDVIYLGENDNRDASHTLKLNTESLNFDYYNHPFLKINRYENFVGKLKNIAWSYENEVRIHARLESARRDLEKIAIPLTDEIISNLTVMFGPWINENDIDKYKREINILSNNKLNFEKSIFSNLVEYRSACFGCEFKNAKMIV